MRKFITIIFIQYCFFINGQATIGGSNANQFTSEMYPKSPDAAGLSKFIDIPSGSYSGIADFTIPIFSFEIDGNTFPISLNYSTSGIKVDQIASRVGLGWNLNIGGVFLSEQVIGRTDSYARSILRDGFDPAFNIDDLGLAMELTANPVPYQDIIPDVFTYSTLNGGGRFIFDSSGDFGIPMPYNDTKIRWKQSQVGISITDSKGVFYNFNRSAQFFNGNTCHAAIGSGNSSSNYLISDITTTKGTRIIFNYERANKLAKFVNSLTQQEKVAEYLSPSTNPSNSLTLENCYNYSISYEESLKEIKFPSGTISFLYNDDLEPNSMREDLPNEKYLRKVIIKDIGNNVIKEITLNYSYFTSTETINLPKKTENQDKLAGIDKRLKLTSVFDSFTNSSYDLSYYEDHALPHRLSYSQDFWGVYNGKSNTETSIPTTTYYDQTNRIRLFEGADKYPDFEYGIVGNLKNIKYPTGGQTEILYEPDEFSSDMPLIKYIVTHPSHYFSTEDTNPVVDTDFTIPEGAVGKIKIVFYGNNIPTNTPSPGGPGPNLGRIEIKKVGGVSIINTNQGGEYDKDMPAGTYNIKLTSIIDDDGVRKNTAAQIEWIRKSVDTTFAGNQTGTIRVKEIRSFSEDNGSLIRKYTYLNPKTGSSSGLNHGLDFFSPIKRIEYPGNSFGGINTKTVVVNNQGAETAVMNGKPVAYEFVQELYHSPQKQYKKQYHFINNLVQKQDPNDPLYTGWPFKDLSNGLLLSETLFNGNNDTIRVTSNNYNFDTYFNQRSKAFNIASPFGINQVNSIYLKNTLCVGGEFGSCQYNFEWSRNLITNMWIKNLKTTTTDYVNNQPTLVTEQTAAYSTSSLNRHTFPTEQKTEVIGSGVSVSQHFQYALEKGNEYLRGKNIISVPLITETRKTTNGFSKLISKVERSYPTSDAEARTRIVNNINDKDIPLLYDVFSSDLKAPSTTTLEATYDKYDTDGNLLQYTTRSGISTAIVWGYNNTQPIAKVDGATYAQVSDLATAIISASNADGDLALNTDESALLSALDAFRKKDTLEGFQITTYTYDPLIGVRSITPPSGIRENYIYDSANRLKEVRDVNGRILKENKYNYKH